MRIDYVSEQEVEIVVTGADDAAYPVLHCTANSTPGSFNPYDGGYPPEGPEFEFVTVSLDVPRVNRREGQSEYESALQLTYTQFCALVGREAADLVIDRAMDEAADSGQF
jgi:hypothetical protein